MSVARSTRGAPVFAFSGCAPIFGAPIRALATREPVFASALRACDEAVGDELGWSFSDKVLSLPDDESIVDLPTNFPLGVALQLSMLAVLRDRGIEPSAVVGLSAGELSSAFAAGVLSLRDALRIAVHGGRWMNREACALRMAIVWLPVRECEALLERVAPGAAVAGTMESAVTIVSGQAPSIAKLSSALAQRDVRAHVLPFPWGVHTAAIHHGRADFERVIGSVETHPAVRPIMSTSLGRWGRDGEDFGLPHWWDLFSSPVQLSKAVTELVSAGADTFVEVGLGAALSHLVGRLGGTVTGFDEALAEARGGT